MEQTIDNPVRSRRSRAEIMNLLDEFRKSNESVKAFCTKHHVSKASFHKWQSRYRSKPALPGFAAIQITPSVANTSAALFAEIKGIKIYQPVVASYLKELAL